MIAPRRAPEPPARQVVVVGSGKGGVGKSTLSLNVALALAEAGAAVGLLDADVYGPDIPLMVNLTRKRPVERWSLWDRRGIRLEPVERFGVRIMSVGFLLGERQVFPWRGPTLPWVLHQLLYDVDWGELDYLLVDLPPGTADLQQELLSLTQPAGAVVVVTPQDVAHLDAKKFVSLLRGAHVNVIGGVQNMSGFVCPHCGEAVEVFPSVADERSIWHDGVALLGTLPLSPAIAAVSERGTPVLVADPAGGDAQIFREIATRIRFALDEAQTSR